MDEVLEFGQSVRVPFVLNRFLVDSGGHRAAPQRRRSGHREFDLEGHDFVISGWPGDPVPLDAGTAVSARFELEPGKLPDKTGWGGGRGRALVRWRRLPIENLFGLVAAVTIRHEGSIEPGGRSGFEGEAEPPYFASDRRFEVVEVLVRPIDLRSSATLALALRADLEIVPK